GHLLEGVGLGRRACVADAAVVGCEAAVVPAERHALERPAAGVRPEALDQEDGRAVTAAPHVVRDLDAVVGGDLLHAASACWSRTNVRVCTPRIYSRVTPANAYPLRRDGVRSDRRPVPP